MKFLVAGDGPGALSMALKLQRSRSHHKVYTWPFTFQGSGLIPLPGVNAESTSRQVCAVCERLGIQLVVLAGGDVIASGLGNVLQTARIPCFGPSRVQAHFDWDRTFALSVAAQAKIQMTQNPTDHEFSFHVLAGTRKLVPLAFTYPTKHGAKTQSTPHPKLQTDSFMEAVVTPFLMALMREGITYQGWLSFCGKLTKDNIELTHVACLPPMFEGELVCVADERDWGDLFTFLACREPPQKINTRGAPKQLP